MTRSTALHLDDDLIFDIVDRDLALLRIESQAEALAEDLAEPLRGNGPERIHALARAAREVQWLRTAMPRETDGATTAADVDRAVRFALAHLCLPTDVVDPQPVVDVVEEGHARAA